MKYRNVLAATALVGMMAVTGCSRGALPENNEANYNGERLVRSVSRHAHDMENRAENAAERTTRGVTRGLNRNNRHYEGARQNRHTGIRTNPHERNTRGLQRNHETRHNYANEGMNHAERSRTNEHNRMNGRVNERVHNEHNRVSDRAHRANTPEYALHYDTNNERTVPVSLTDEGTANFFKKQAEPKTANPSTNPTPNATTPQPAQ